MVPKLFGPKYFTALPFNPHDDRTRHKQGQPQQAIFDEATTSQRRPADSNYASACKFKPTTRTRAERSGRVIKEKTHGKPSCCARWAPADMERAASARHRSIDRRRPDIPCTAAALQLREGLPEKRRLLFSPESFRFQEPLHLSLSHGWIYRDVLHLFQPVGWATAL